MPSSAGQLKLFAIGGVVLICGLAIFAYAFPRGFSLTDEALAIYLLSHPNAPMASMDHFVTGHILSLFPWNLVWLRWIATCEYLGATAALLFAVFYWLRRRNGLPDVALPSVFALAGALLCFTAILPIPYYALNLIVACNLFAAVRFSEKKWNRWAADAVMGALAAMVFLARAPIFPFLVASLFLFSWAEGRRAFGRETLLRVVNIAAVAVVVLLVLVALGLDLGTELSLMRVLTITSHRPLEVVARDCAYGAAIIIFAGLLAVGSVARMRVADPAFAGKLLLGGVAFCALAALVCMRAWGFFTPVAGTGLSPTGNDPLRSLGPGLHTGVMALLFSYGWQNRASPGQGRTLLELCVLLYFLCLVPFIGTNTGLWHRSTANMAPLFLAVGIVLSDAVRRAQIPGWIPAPLALITAVPVIAALYASLINHPSSIDGSAWEQSVVLDHPARLEGLHVLPSVAALQASIDRQLASLHFDTRRETLLPGTRRLGLAVLSGANVGANGWYFAGYDRSEVWNCAVMDLWLPTAPDRILAIDVGSFNSATRACLAGYSLPPPGDTMAQISVLQRRNHAGVGRRAPSR